jgi:hypothetical protein
MGKTYKPDKKLVAFANETIKNTKNLEDYKRAICVTFASNFGLTTKEISDILQISPRTVTRKRNELKAILKGEPINGWGGRRYFLLSKKDERKFLTKWENIANKGQLISVKEIQNDLIDFVGQAVSVSSTYNLLNRNGWKKLTKDACNLKSNIRVSKVSKKKRYWFPPTNKNSNKNSS